MKWQHTHTYTHKLFLGTSREHCGGFGSGMRSPAADARAEMSRCAHKAIQCVGWTETPNEIRWCVCRHYLAMTKSALFLFVDAGKFNRGPLEKHLYTRVAVFALLWFCLLLFLLFVGVGGLQSYPPFKKLQQLLRTEVWATDSFSRCCSDRKMVSESKCVLFLHKTWQHTRSKEFYTSTKTSQPILII